MASVKPLQTDREPVAGGGGMIGFTSPRSGAPLWPEGDALVSAVGERVPVVGGIPRFASSDDYAEAFGLQWSLHARTQLDSRTGAHLSETRLVRCAGMPFERFAGLRVLEAGCGAGRFTELLVRAAARVHAVDLSAAAVETNRRNIGDRANYTIAQADIRALPFPAGAFDVVVCLGVLQHTPSPERSLAALWRMVAPGGLLVLDHYTWTLSRVTKLGPLYRMVLKRLPPARARRITDVLVNAFFPLHWAVRRSRLLQTLLSRVSPCLAYCHIYPELTREQHEDWCRLDTFDELTDRYKRLRTAGRIRRTLTALGATEVEATRRANVVEARCRKPPARPHALSPAAGVRARDAAPVIVRPATAAERADWDTLVARFPNCRVVHKHAWIEWLEASGCGTPLYLVFDRGGEVVGAIPGLLVRLGLLQLYGSPLPGWQTPAMGPVFDPARISTDELVGALVPFLERHHGVHHVELLSGHLDARPMQALGFRSEAVPTYRARLYPGDEARMLKALKESARRNIRRAAKLGLVARFEDDEAFVTEHYAQLREVFVRGGNTVSFGVERARAFFRHMRAAGKLLAISVCLPGGENIATGLFTLDERELLLWSWAHRTAQRWYRPTELLTWTVMTRAMAAGCETFDFMGLGDFKAKFGAELDITKTRWVRSRYRWLARARDVAERGYRWQQAVRGRIARMRMFGGGGGRSTDDADHAQSPA